MTSVTCPRCKKESFNRNDIAQKYCSSCKLFWSIDKAKVHIILNSTISAIHDLEVLLSGLETVDSQ
jgi:ribosomal protein L37AE/L43A